MKNLSNIVFLSFALLFTSCSNPQEVGRICSAQFVIHYLTVLTPEGEPADSVQITVSNKVTGNEYEVCKSSICNSSFEGRYVIFHDGFLEEVGSDGETVIVDGIKGDKSFSEEFTFRDDGCHIQKVAGPDSVYLHVSNP